MRSHRTTARLGLIVGGLLGGGFSLQAIAAPQAALDPGTLQPGIAAPLNDPLQGGLTPPALDSPAGAPQAQTPPSRVREPTGNPLWGIPLKSLSVTRERPIFTPSRRPPSPAIAGPPPSPPPPPPPPAGPSRPQLALVGAIANETEGIAIFVNQATRDIVRLRTGENHAGWVLRSVRGREATLQKDRDTVILALPTPTEQNPEPGIGLRPGKPPEL